MSVTFMLDAAACKKTLSPLFPLINRSTVLPILCDVLIHRKESSISFHVTDLESTMTITMPQESGKTGIICIESRRFRHLINNHIDPIINCTFDKVKFSAKNGGFTVGMEGDNFENYPKFPVVESTREFTVDAREFGKQLENALKFVSTDDLRPAMTGILLTDWQDHIYMVCTDAHKMYYKALFKTTTAMKNARAIIPAKGARMFLNLFRKGDVAVRVNDNYIQFESGNAILTSRLIDARYPEFQKVIPDNNLVFALKRSQISSILKICSVFVNHATSQIVWEMSPDKISFYGGDIEFSDEFKFSIPVHNPHKELHNFRFATNSNWFLKILSCLNDEYVKIAHSGREHGALLIDDCCLLMPLMLNQ